MHCATAVCTSASQESVRHATSRVLLQSTSAAPRTSPKRRRSINTGGHNTETRAGDCPSSPWRRWQHAHAWKDLYTPTCGVSCATHMRMLLSNWLHRAEAAQVAAALVQPLNARTARSSRRRTRSLSGRQYSTAHASPRRYRAAAKQQQHHASPPPQPTRQTPPPPVLGVLAHACML